MTERLHSAMQLRRFAGQNELARRTEREIVATARHLGFDILHGPMRQHRCVLEDRPSATKVYRELLGDTEAAAGFGATLFSYLSAVDHGTIYGLLEAAVEQKRTHPGAPLLAGLAVTASRVRVLLTGATLAYATAADRYARLNGWADHAWTSNQQNAIRAAKQHLDATPSIS